MSSFFCYIPSYLGGNSCATPQNECYGPNLSFTVDCCGNPTARSSGAVSQNPSTIDPETFVDGAGQTIKNFVDVGIGTQIYSSTVGALWSAATGTVSTDAKNILIHDQMVAQMRASNFGMTWAAAYAQATGDVTRVLTQAKADPSQASVGNNPGLDNLKKWLEIGAGLLVAYLAIELYLDYKGGNK